jgi:biopolymer transport protein TolR
MSISLEPQGKPGKRPLDASLNLVPYIDLLTCMVAFLLITAVWTELAQLKTSQRPLGPEGEQPPPPATKISLLVSQDGVNVMVNAERELVPDQNGQVDWTTLGKLLKELKGQFPDLDDVQIASEDSVLFDRLTGVMDASIAAGFPGVSVVPGGQEGL